MFRSLKAARIAPLLSSLLLWTATAAGVTLATSALTGCEDENEPETYVKRLSDPAQRQAAVTRLVQFFEDAMTRDNKNREGPVVKPLLDQIVEPMAQACVAGDLDERTSSKLIKFISDSRDPRGEPCLIKTLKDYKPDTTEEDVRSAVRSIAAMKLKSASGPLMEVFLKLHASKPKATAIARDVHDAMIALSDPGWEGQLIGTLAHSVDMKDGSNLANEFFWQATSAELLGHLKSANAVKPLIKLMLSPSKADTQTTAILALVKIGKPSIGPATALLLGQDADLVAYSKLEQSKMESKGAAAKGADTAYIGTAALILATIGREETQGPLIEALASTKDDVARAVIARELTKLPKSPRTVQAFEDAFDKTSTSQSLPPSGQGARELLLEASGFFFEPTMIPWIVKVAQAMKGDDSDLGPIRQASLFTALKLATPEQLGTIDDLASGKSTDINLVLVSAGPNKDAVIKAVAELSKPAGEEGAKESPADAAQRLKAAAELVNAAPKTIKAQLPKQDAEEMKKKLSSSGATVDLKASTVGDGFDKETKITRELLKSCGTKVDCYLGKLADPNSQTEANQFVGIKSAYMVGIMGTPDSRQKVLDVIPKLSNPAIRFVAGQVLDYLSPKGDPELAKKLQAIVDDGEASKDQAKINANRPLKTVIYRLNARAQ